MVQGRLKDRMNKYVYSHPDTNFIVLIKEIGLDFWPTSDSLSGPTRFKTTWPFLPN